MPSLTWLSIFPQQQQHNTCSSFSFIITQSQNICKIDFYNLLRIAAKETDVQIKPNILI